MATSTIEVALCLLLNLDHTFFGVRVLTVQGRVAKKLNIERLYSFVGSSGCTNQILFRGLPNETTAIATVHSEMLYVMLKSYVY